MAIILHIDTATEFASICLSDGLNILGFEAHQEQKNHASFLQPAIKKMMQEAKVDLKNIDAISVTNGPGSYTGLRVGLASAKGLCFALQMPLITLNTLEVMATAAIEENNNSDFLYCPMIDARRMEVFTALYTNELTLIKDIQPLILEEKSFSDYLKTEKIIFSGSGAVKFKSIEDSENAVFSEVQHSAKNMLSLALNKFNKKEFADVAYASPNYGKEFYTTAKKIF